MALQSIIFALADSGWRLVGFGALIIVLSVLLYISWKNRYFAKREG